MDKRGERRNPSMNQKIWKNREVRIEPQPLQVEREWVTHTQTNGTRDDIQQPLSAIGNAGHTVADGSKTVEHKGQAAQRRLIAEALENNVGEDLETNDSDEISEYFSKVKVHLDLQIPKEEMDWLFKSAVAKLGADEDISTIQNDLLTAAKTVTVQRISGLMILLKFATEVDLNRSLKVFSGVLKKWFLSVQPWVQPWAMVEVENRYAIWVKME